MRPDATLEQEQADAEAAQLAAAAAAMSPDELAQVATDATALKAAQAAEDTPEAIATIPMVTMDDLTRDEKEIPIEVTSRGGALTLRHELPTNGILYADVGLDIRSVPLAELPLLPLFTRMLLECGAGDMDEVGLSRAIGARTGGVSASTMFSPVRGAAPEGGAAGTYVTDGAESQAWLFVRGKATAENAGSLLDLVTDVLVDAKLDNSKRAIEILKASIAGMESSLVGAGHSYADTRLAARLTPAGALAEMMGGVSYFGALKQLLAEAEADWPAVLARLEALRGHALASRAGAVINLSGDAKTLETVDATVEAFAAKLPLGDAAPGAGCDWGTVPLVDGADEGFALPTQVNYVGKGGRLYDVGERVPGSAGVAARFLRTGYLWDNVRVIGGAYGGMCRFAAETGRFSFLSYRDPNLAQTLDAYDAAAAYLQELELTDEALAQAVIGAAGDLDQPMMPDAKGFVSMRRYLTGEPLAARQAHRDEVLATSADDIRAFGARLAAMNARAKAAVFGSKAAFDAAKAAGAELEVNSVL